jgi:hypothetical protein
VELLTNSPRFAPLLVETILSSTIVPIFAARAAGMAVELFQKSKPFTLL